MPEPFLGEIRIFTGNYAPVGWAFCNGQLLLISQYTALFSLLGTMYGGNGTSTFALPNLAGCAPMHQGAGPGLTTRSVGEETGEVSVTLTKENMPIHTHQVMATPTQGTSGSPSANVFAEAISGGKHGVQIPLYTSQPNASMHAEALANTGGSLPHNNMQPYLGLSFIIALQGEFPVRG